MNRLAPTAALAVAVALIPMSQAAAWSRSGSFTTWRGTYHTAASGGCAGGTCTRTRSITGANGGVVTRTGSITRTGPHRYSVTRTTTGPRGNSVTRSGTIRTDPYWARN